MTVTIKYSKDKSIGLDTLVPNPIEKFEVVTMEHLASGMVGLALNDGTIRCIPTHRIIDIKIEN